jgi:hypothetical protein
MRSRFNTGERPHFIRLAIGEFEVGQVWASDRVRWTVLELIEGSCPEVVVKRSGYKACKPYKTWQVQLRRTLYLAKAKLVGKEEVVL